MPQRRNDRKQYSLWLDQRLKEEIDLLLLDPVRLKVKHGSFGHLVEKLLRDWLRDQKHIDNQTAPGDN